MNRNPLIISLLALLILVGCAGIQPTEFRTLPNADPPIAVWGPRLGLQYKGTSFGTFNWPAELRPCQEVWLYQSPLSAGDQQRMWNNYSANLKARDWTIETQEANKLTASKDGYWLWMFYSKASPRITLTIRPCEFRWY